MALFLTPATPSKRVEPGAARSEVELEAAEDQSRRPSADQVVAVRGGARSAVANVSEVGDRAPKIPPPPKKILSRLMRPFLSGSLRQQQKMFKNSARTASKGPNRNRIPIPLEPLKDGHTIDPKERTFLEAAERGDKHTMIRCLQPPNPVNVNCTNILGRSAIQIAVDNENVEIVELLLQQVNTLLRQNARLLSR